MRYLLSCFGYTPRADGAEAAARDAFTVADLAVRLGFDGLAGGHHLLGGEHHVLQPAPLAGALTARTPEGFPLVLTQILGHVQPVRLAEELATLSALNGGGISLLGVLGYAEREFAALGVERSTRARRFEETVEVVRRLWGGRPVDHDSATARMAGEVIGCGPVGDLDIWVGADASAGVRRAARLGDAWAMASHLSRSELAVKRAELVSERARLGLAPPAVQPLSRITYVAPTDEEAVATLRPYLEERWRIYAGVAQADEMDDPADFTAPYDQLRHGRFLVGSPEHVAREVRRYRDELGVTHLTSIVLLPGLDPALRRQSIELLAHEVLPAV